MTTQVYEGNESCIVFANSEATKPHTKHIALKWHHFKDKLNKDTYALSRFIQILIGLSS
jgi:hypothetical protein